MKLYYSGVRERAEIARSARAKVNGSRTKKVELSTDGMTNAQIDKLHGPVIIYRFVPEVPKEELASWPADLREEYRKRFGR